MPVKYHSNKNSHSNNHGQGNEYYISFVMSFKKYIYGSWSGSLSSSWNVPGHVPDLGQRYVPGLGVHIKHFDEFFMSWLKLFICVN